jgi:hypothetical protein
MSLLLEEVHPAPMQSGVGVPIKTEHFACLLDGVHTEFILNVLEDQLFFVITQLGKFGTIVSMACRSATKTNYKFFFGNPLLKFTLLCSLIYLVFFVDIFRINYQFLAESPKRTILQLGGISNLRD